MTCCALSAGGATARELLIYLEREPCWTSCAPALIRWRQWVQDAVICSQSSGAPLSPLLKEGARLIRGDEKRLGRLRGVQAQGAFQAAVLLVLPWAASAAVGEWGWNMLFAAGMTLQLMGLCAYSLLMARAARPPRGEWEFLRVLLRGAWLRVVAGSSLLSALSQSAAGEESSPVGKRWRQWAESLTTGGQPGPWDGFPESDRLGHALEMLHLRGAPVAEALLNYLDDVEARGEALWEERLALLPYQVSLVMCFLFGPALFLMVFSSLWLKTSLLMQ